MDETQEKVSGANSVLKDIAEAVFGGSPKEQFIKGAVIGGVAAYLLTNRAAQEALFKAAINFGSASAEFFGDIQDRFGDIKAEIDAAKRAEPSAGDHRAECGTQDR